MNKFVAVSLRLTLLTSFTLFCGWIIFTASNVPVQAQDSDKTTLSTEGIVGDVDKGRRAPVLTYSTSISADGNSAQILADTQIINEEYRKYPISVDFYVNGKLFSKQFRSLELPAPLGIDVPKELAPVPFNYSIVATLLAPNREFATVAQGALTASGSSTGALQCTSTETVGGDATGVVVTGTVDSSITADNTLSFTLTDGDKSSVVTLTVAASSSSTTRDATGTVVVQQGDAASVSYDVSGSVVASGSVVSSVNVSSSANELVLSCETVATTTAASTFVGDETEGSDSKNAELDGSNLDSVLNAPTGSNPADGDEGFGPGPNGATNFIPLDKVGGVVVVN